MSDEEKKTSWISETVFLTFITILAYAIVIRYDEGFCRHFDIPGSMVTPTLSSIGTVFKDFLVFALGPVILIEAVYTFVLILPEQTTRQTWVKLTMHASAYAFWFGWLDESIVTGVALFLAALFFSWIILENQAGKKDGCGELIKPVASHARNSVFLGFLLPKSNFQKTLVMVFLFSTATSHSLGIRSAKKQTEFLVPTTKTDYVVIRQYGDRMLLKQFERTTKKLLDDLIVLDGLTSDIANPVSFKVEKVGPLSRSEP